MVSEENVPQPRKNTSERKVANPRKRLDEIRSKQVVVRKKAKISSGSTSVEAGPSSLPVQVDAPQPLQVRKPVRKRCEFLVLKSRASTPQFLNALKDLNELQRASVKEAGFGSLLELNIAELPTRLSYWLLDSYNPVNSTLYLADGTGLYITEDDVQLVLGFPRGNIEITKWKRSQEERIFEEWKGKFGPENAHISMGDVIGVMKACDDGGVWFKRHFAVLVSTFFVDTPHNGYVRPMICNHLDDVSQMRNLNWCQYVMRSLIGCSQKWLKKRTPFFSGPLGYVY